MLAHEKRAFFKFFLTYFISVAILILSAGYFYYEQTYNQHFKAEHFLVLDYARQLKSGNLKEDNMFHYEIEDVSIEGFSMDNIELTSEYFIKRVPYKWNYGYFVIYKKRADFDKKVERLFYQVVFSQSLLLAIFAFISLFLAKNALKPMQEAILKLDSFSKDLIHDLNTPVTAIGLNMKILEKSEEFSENKALLRIKKSVTDISELHQSLRMLLEEETFQLEAINMPKVIEEVVLVHKNLYPKIEWKIECQALHVKSNEKALKQVLHNIISNACKYNKEDGVVYIKAHENTLSISDSGIGIKNPSKVFDRNYTEHSSGYGIGLDIVKRLCENMGIDIAVESSAKGTRFSLKF